jgi:hypothetical protein
MSRRTLLTASLLAATATLALPAVAHADPPEHFHNPFDETFENENVCGINVDIHVQGHLNLWLRTDHEGNVNFEATRMESDTFTADNGKSVLIQIKGLYAETVPIIDEAAGTSTYDFTVRGQWQTIRTPHGPALLKDVGLITLAAVVDIEADQFLSLEVLVSHGPHPQADSDFTVFCDVFTSALA